MAKYRKKPVIVEAEQWFPGKDVPGVKHSPANSVVNEYWFVETIYDQIIWLTPGDWVIKEPDGVHFYPCKPDVFEATYEAVT